MYSTRNGRIQILSGGNVIVGACPVEFAVEDPVMRYGGTHVQSRHGTVRVSLQAHARDTLARGLVSLQSRDMRIVLTTEDKTSAWVGTIRRTYTGAWLVHGPGKRERKRYRTQQQANAERARRGKTWSRTVCSHACLILDRIDRSPAYDGMTIHLVGSSGDLRVVNTTGHEAA